MSGEPLRTTPSKPLNNLAEESDQSAVETRPPLSVNESISLTNRSSVG